MTQEIIMHVASDEPVAMRTQEYISGGGGGTSDYEALSNKPSINGVTLAGNKSTEELGIEIPTKTSDLQNDSGFITSAPVTTVNGQTGDVSITVPSTAEDVGAVSATQGAANANKFLVTDNSGNVTTRTLDSWQGGSF